MKAVLVIDEMPLSCNACDFNRFAFTHWGCSIHNNDSVTDEMKESIRPSWCPLKSMPRRQNKDTEKSSIEYIYEADTLDKFQSRGASYLYGHIDGWNDCLEEIGGK